MNEQPRYFRIENISTVKHTSETAKVRTKVMALPNISFNQFGKRAIVKMAKGRGYQCEEELPHEKTVQDAFSFLMNLHPGATKSYVVRKAIVDYSEQEL